MKYVKIEMNYDIFEETFIVFVGELNSFDEKSQTFVIKNLLTYETKSQEEAQEKLKSIQSEYSDSRYTNLHSQILRAGV